jgi:hypothetical protein
LEKLEEGIRNNIEMTKLGMISDEKLADAQTVFRKLKKWESRKQ